MFLIQTRRILVLESSFSQKTETFFGRKMFEMHIVLCCLFFPSERVVSAVK